VLNRLLAAAAAVCISVGAQAQSYTPRPVEDLLAQDVTYDSAIPKPEDVTGFASGQIISTPEMLHSYARAVAAASDRVSIEVIGRSHFGRPILRVTTTSPANQARLEEIREAHLAFSDPGRTAEVTEETPVIVQMTHGVHGTEASGYDSSAPLLYFLAAAQGEEIEALLETTVINQIILINPDGASRFAHDVNIHHAEAPVADPQHREHTGSWPWGRTNHYWFDLNRQWLPVTQPEAAALVDATHHWMPNVAADLHEMGSNSTFFISPGPVDGLHPLLSQAGLELNLEMNELLDEQFSAEGALYVAEERFDDFYLGYGSSYPGLLGGVPYLFEQSSVRGIIQDTERGTLRYDDKIGQQARTAIALIRASHARRQDLLNHQQAFFRESLRLAGENATSAYVFTSHDEGRLAAFLDLLAHHRIDVFELDRAVTASGVRYQPGQSYVVPLAQANYRVIEGLFETRVIEDKTAFYDVSGWTQPLAYDLDYAALRPGAFGQDAIGDQVTARITANEPPANSSIAYVIDWSEFYAPRAVYRLLDAGLHLRVIPDEIELQTEAGNVSMARGSILVPVAGQVLEADAIHELVSQRAREDGAVIHAASSSATASGSDLGGFSLSNVERPNVLLVTGESVNSGDAGELWHLLDHHMHMPVVMIDAENLSDSDLSGYTHILLPDGRYDPLGESFAETLSGWVEDGGVLVATRGGARFAAEQEIAAVKTVDTASRPEDEAPSGPQAYATIDDWDVEHTISGALFEGVIDTTHPLGYGYRDATLPVHKIGTTAFATGEDPFATPLRYASGDPILSGYASQRNRDALAGLGAVHATRRGEGSVILFADDPYFRAYMLGSSKMVLNAIFFGNDFRGSARGEGQ